MLPNDEVTGSVEACPIFPLDIASIISSALVILSNLWAVSRQTNRGQRMPQLSGNMIWTFRGGCSDSMEGAAGRFLVVVTALKYSKLFLEQGNVMSSVCFLLKYWPTQRKEQSMCFT